MSELRESALYLYEAEQAAQKAEADKIEAQKKLDEEAIEKYEHLRFDRRKIQEGFMDYKRFVKEDNYRRICTKESFDNYFLTNIVTSLVTDIEYKEITDSISTPNDFAQVFTKIFSKNEDKFKDFCERVSRDSTIISDAKMLKNFVKSCLVIEDELLYRLFNIREFCENIYQL